MSLGCMKKVHATYLSSHGVNPMIVLYTSYTDEIFGNRILFWRLSPTMLIKYVYKGNCNVSQWSENKCEEHVMWKWSFGLMHSNLNSCYAWCVLRYWKESDQPECYEHSLKSIRQHLCGYGGVSVGNIKVCEGIVNVERFKWAAI